MQNYDDYILFILGANDNYLSRFIRDLIAVTDDLFGVYEKCVYVATKFAEYDTHPTQSQLDAFYYFISEYKTQISNWFMRDEEFEIEKE